MNELIDLPRQVTSAQIDRLQTAMAAMPQLLIEPKHFFGTDVYVREVTLPADTTAIGKIHKTRHVCIISKGDVTVLTEHGLERIKAPATIISEPGTRRVVYAHEESVWTTIHGTKETDIDKLEAELVIDAALGAPEDIVCLS